MKYIVNIIVFLLLTGCSSLSTERTPEETAELNTQIQAVHDSVFIPVFILALETCKYHMKNATWPQAGHTRTSGNFDHLEVVSSNNSLIEFNLKLRAVNGSANFTINKFPFAPEETPYGFKLRADFRGGYLNFKKFFSCSDSGLTQVERMDYSKKLTSYLNFYSAMSQVKQPNDSSFAGKSNEWGVRTALCLLLKLDPSQCD